MHIELGDVVRMKKQHPCGNALFEITRVGADVKLKCLGCGRVVMLDRVLFEKRAKEIVASAKRTEDEA